MKKMGFTLVEVMVVIGVIVLLAAISTMGYAAYRDRANASAAQAHLQEINLALKRYYAKNGSYPPSGSGSDQWSRLARDGNDFLKELSPEFIRVMRDVESGSKTDNRANTYVYRSSGSEYKLLRLAPANSSVPPGERRLISSDMQDPVGWSSSNPQFKAWGYWTNGARNWSVGF